MSIRLSEMCALVGAEFWLHLFFQMWGDEVCHPFFYTGIEEFTFDFSDMDHENMFHNTESMVKNPLVRKIQHVDAIAGLCRSLLVCRCSLSESCCPDCSTAPANVKSSHLCENYLLIWQRVCKLLESREERESSLLWKTACDIWEIIDAASPPPWLAPRSP